MSATQSHDITTGGIAALAAGNDRITQVHGVILGLGDITNGLSGKRTRWPADVLESMAEDGLFEGKPITLADSLDPEQHVGVEATDDGARVTAAVSMDEKMGEVLRTEFDPEAGLVFEGFVMDWVADELVATGLAQVSPVIARELEQVGEDDGEALFEPTSVDAARDLALVADGAAPSNDIAVGALEPAIAEALSAHFDVDLPVEALSVSKPSFNGWSEAAWDAPTLSGTFDGSMEDARNSATFIRNDGETFDDLSLFIVDGEGRINTNALDSAWRLAPQTEGTSEDDVSRLRSMYEDFATEANEAGAITDDEFDDTWQERHGKNIEAGSAGGMSGAGGDDGPEDSPTGQGQSTSATNGLPSMDDLTPDEQELVAAARQLDDPTVVEAEVREQLNDLEEQINEHEELIEAAADLDDPEVVAEEELAAMQERIDVVEEMMAEALTQQKGLLEATVEAMPLEAMASEFQTDDGGLDVEALTQNPESGSAPTGGGDDGPTDEDKERIQEIDRKLDALGSAIPQSRIEALQEEAVDLAGTEDYEGALEVL